MPSAAFRYAKYIAEDEKKDRGKSSDRFMDMYTELVDRVNELNLVGDTSAFKTRRTTRTRTFSRGFVARV
jgi:hypothetical protein